MIIKFFQSYPHFALLLEVYIRNTNNKKYTLIDTIITVDELTLAHLRFCEFPWPVFPSSTSFFESDTWQPCPVPSVFTPSLLWVIRPYPSLQSVFLAPIVFYRCCLLPLMTQDIYVLRQQGLVLFLSGHDGHTLPA